MRRCIVGCGMGRSPATLLVPARKKFLAGCFHWRTASAAAAEPLAEVSAHRCFSPGSFTPPRLTHVRPSLSGQSICVNFSNQERAACFQARWLLDNCDSRRQMGTGQKIRFPSSIPRDLAIASATIGDDGTRLQIKWREETKSAVTERTECVQSLFEAEWLACHAIYSDDGVAPEQMQPPTARRLGAGSDLPSVQYNDVMVSDDSVAEWLHHIDTSGLCIVRGVPLLDGQVAETASRIAQIQKTIYGRVFDVRAETEPINIAYTSVALSPHMDLSYYESPPGLQFLHCLAFDPAISGGLSTFIDALAAAEDLRETNPQEFETLCRIPATFQKIHAAGRKSPVNMVYRRPHIDTNASGDVIAVHWSPPFEGPLKAAPQEVDAYYNAYSTFAQLIGREEHIVSLRLSPGDMVSFNQRRMLHGRTAFENSTTGGNRHFQGCYINIDEYLNRLRVLLSDRNGGSFEPTRAGNGDHR